jgi:hypothetical protein
MTDLVERYVHQVGRYLPAKERAEIEAELRSQIHDQLDDRFGGAPTPAEVATVLTEFGYPYQIATHYTGDQYLVGPLLYPLMMMVLRYGWLIVPLIVAFLDIFAGLVSTPQPPLLNLLVETVIAVVQATLIFSAVVVLIFATIQRAIVHIKDKDKESSFNPLDLPQVDDPHAVDRVEAAFGLAIGTIITMVLLYWMQVGGLTLRFNLSDPGEVIPFPATWMIVLILFIIGQVVLQLLVLRHNCWNGGLLLAQTLLEVGGLICLYFAVLVPVFARLDINPDLPELIAIILAVITLLTKGAKLARLWNYSSAPSPTLNTRHNE